MSAFGSVEDRGGSTGEVGQGQVGEESGLKETKPRIQLPAKFDSPQLKAGTANQRHPFSRAATSQHNSIKEIGISNGTRNSKVV